MTTWPQPQRAGLPISHPKTNPNLHGPITIEKTSGKSSSLVVIAFRSDVEARVRAVATQIQMRNQKFDGHAQERCRGHLKIQNRFLATRLRIDLVTSGRLSAVCLPIWERENYQKNPNANLQRFLYVPLESVVVMPPPLRAKEETVARHCSTRKGYFIRCGPL